MDVTQIEAILYGDPQNPRRFTQDFPILPDVWINFGHAPLERHELLLTPHFQSSAPFLAKALRDRIGVTPHAAGDERAATGKPRILLNESVVLASFTFAELVRIVLPLSTWWSWTIAPLLEAQSLDVLLGAVVSATTAHPNDGQPPAVTPARGDKRAFDRLVEVVGTIWHQRTPPVSRSKRKSSSTAPPAAMPTLAEQRAAFRDLLGDITSPDRAQSVLWSVNLNRKASWAIWRSRLAVKADAAVSLFNIKAEGLRWAVIDAGIDATHPAFARRTAGPAGEEPRAARDPDDPDDQFPFRSRVVRTYDFLRLKELLDPDSDTPADAKSALARLPPDQRQMLEQDLQKALEHGRAIDWDLLEPFLRVPHDSTYKVDPIAQTHGTHVAGIIAGYWPEAKTLAVGRPLIGMCPDLELYDIRALGVGADEFTVMAALQFVRYLNAHKDVMVVHGVNVSLAVPHDVANFACGRTPVCQECERVVSSGVVVVAAAGNRGFNKSSADIRNGAMGDYRYISITDPGNADAVITVGSTHRYMPHTYGVSYFSSRGPTGDGRTKPDLVAPGERIDSPTPDGNYDTLDGTSMAAPHVSGAAALLMARHKELIGQPERIKKILCSTATDLGREPRFQGHGMLDVLRALQSV